MRWRVFPSVLGGSVEVPGDKSISHRALLIGALAGGAEVMNLAPGGDVQSTCSCLEALGVQVERLNGNGASSSIRLRIDGMRATVGDETSLDCGNSGTTMRLLAGVLAGQRIAARLEGDSSLS
ncbi:MAG: 3-phosphoshikimate 1-carboxyvinyltransferase, partial [Chloroflexota bacterium]